MPITIAIHTSDGKLQDAPYQAESLSAAAKLEPSGIYTVSRTYYQDQTILLDAHFDRLEESAQLEDIPLDLDRQGIRSSLRTLVERAGLEEARFRLTISRQQPDQTIITLEPLQLVSDAMRQEGVAVSTLYLPRVNPRAKRTEWIAVRNEARARLEEDAYEGIRLTADGHLSEGFSSNFYAVKDGFLRTAEEDILHGVARRILLTVAPDILPVDFHPLHRGELAEVQESLLTSSGRGVVPIVRIDGITIGTGTPGPKTRTLAQAYDDWVDAHLEPI